MKTLVMMKIVMLTIQTRLDDLFTNLDSLDDKCGQYEEKQKIKDQEEKEEHKKMIQEILDRKFKNKRTN